MLRTPLLRSIPQTLYLFKLFLLKVISRSSHRTSPAKCTVAGIQSLVPLCLRTPRLPTLPPLFLFTVYRRFALLILTLFIILLLRLALLNSTLYLYFALLSFLLFPLFLRSVPLIFTLLLILFLRLVLLISTVCLAYVLRSTPFTAVGLTPSCRFRGPLGTPPRSSVPSCPQPPVPRQK